MDLREFIGTPWFVKSSVSDGFLYGTDCAPFLDVCIVILPSNSNLPSEVLTNLPKHFAISGSRS